MQRVLKMSFFAQFQTIMNKIRAILNKELESYFKSPIAYVVVFIGIAIFNVFFFMIIDENREATLRDMFTLIQFMFVFFVPIVTMRTLAEEREQGTLEFLLTTPTSPRQIVIGKFLGSFIFLSLLTLVVVPYYIVLTFFSHPDFGTFLSGLVGILFESALFISIGLLCSSWTKNQIIACMTSFVFIFLLYFSFSFIKYFGGPVEKSIRYFSCLPHLENFSSGYFSLSDLVYFLSLTWFCLFLTRISLEYNKV
jgi:ABC-2 type transport system permease protein